MLCTSNVTTFVMTPFDFGGGSGGSPLHFTQPQPSIAARQHHYQPQHQTFASHTVTTAPQPHVNLTYTSLLEVPYERFAEGSGAPVLVSNGTSASYVAPQHLLKTQAFQVALPVYSACPHYSQLGTCMLGASCRLVHTVQLVAPPPQPLLEASYQTMFVAPLQPQPISTSATVLLDSSSPPSPFAAQTPHPAGVFSTPSTQHDMLLPMAPLQSPTATLGNPTSSITILRSGSFSTLTGFSSPTTPRVPQAFTTRREEGTPRRDRCPTASAAPSANTNTKRSSYTPPEAVLSQGLQSMFTSILAKPPQPRAAAKRLRFSNGRQRRGNKPIAVPAAAVGDTQPGPRQLIVNYLAPRVDTAGLRQLFEAFGEVEDALVVSDSRTGASRGFGFVVYKLSADAATAIDAASGRVLLGKRVRIGYLNPQFPVDTSSRLSLSDIAATLEPLLNDDSDSDEDDDAYFITFTGFSTSTGAAADDGTVCHNGHSRDTSCSDTFE